MYIIIVCISLRMRRSYFVLVTISITSKMAACKFFQFFYNLLFNTEMIVYLLDILTLFYYNW